MDEAGDTPAQVGTALTRDEGRAKVLSLLSPQASEPDKVAEKASEPQREEERETPADPNEAAANGGDEPSLKSDAETPSETEPEAPRVRLKDGTEVTLDEVEDWRKGTLRQSDYTRKTQELATSRKEIEQRQAAIAETERQFSQAIDVAMTVVQARMPQPPDASMLETDPIGYIQQEAAYKAAVEEMGKLQRAKQEHEEKSSIERKQAFNEWAAKEHETLLDRVPEMKDPAKAKVFLETVIETLPAYGFSKEDLAGIYDHRLVLVLKDAVAYRKLMASKPKADAKAKDAVPVQTPGRQSSPDDAKVKAIQAERQQLRKTGNRNVAQKLIADILRSGT